MFCYHLCNFPKKYISTANLVRPSDGIGRCQVWLIDIINTMIAANHSVLKITDFQSHIRGVNQRPLFTKKTTFYE